MSIGVMYNVDFALIYCFTNCIFMLTLLSQSTLLSVFLYVRESYSKLLHRADCEINDIENEIQENCLF